MAERDPGEGGDRSCVGPRTMAWLAALGASGLRGRDVAAFSRAWWARYGSLEPVQDDPGEDDAVGMTLEAIVGGPHRGG